MKKIYSIILLVCVALSASAASKTKLYVNPGHGGYGDNDRQTTMPTVNGVKLPVGDNGYNKSNCFWESSGNTYRALGVQYFWKKYINSNIVLSRSENNEAGDLSLSTISKAASSYGGYFMSLHTNAGNSSANYMLVMYSATSKSNPSGERVAGSKAMSVASAKWQDAVILTNETYTTARAMTDRNFYGGQGLGVLNTNTAPGYLAESWFHDYRPEAFRMCNKEYNYFLAWQMVRAYLESPGGVGGTAVIHPIIVGDIRDLSESCGYTSYTTRGRDKYLALNGAKVTLRNVNTGGTKTYTTDQFNNGFYAFYDLNYGATYEVTVEKSGYKTQSKTVTVGSTDTQHLLSFDMVEGVASGISVSPASVDFGEVTAETSTSKTISVTGTELSSAISVSSSNTTQFSISATSLAKTGGTLTVTYKPSAAGSHSTTITLTSGTNKKTIVVSGSAKNPPLTFTEGWNFSETTGKKAAWMTDYTSFRNMAFGAGRLYVVNNSSEILILKAQTGEKLGQLNMTGVTGGTLNVIDVKYIDGKVVACNLATTAEGQQVLKVYVWDNDNATPRVLLNTSDIGGTVRLGDTFNIQGDLTNGTLYFAEGKADTDTKVVSYTITNGVASTTPSVLSVTEDGTVGVQFGLSPRVLPEANGKFWCVGQNYYPTLFDSDGLLMATVNAKALKEEVAGNTFKAFTFKGTSYGLATTYEPNATTAERLRKGRVVLLDGTAGWAEASNIGEYPSAGLGTTRNTSMSSGVEVAVNGTSGVEMWVLVHNQGIAYYKNGTVPTYSYEQTPEISAPSEVSMTATEGQSATQKVTVSGQLLTGNISVALSGSSAFSIDKTSLGSTGGDITITYKPTAAGSHEAQITLTAAGAATKTITVKGKAESAIAEGLTKVWQNTSSVPGAAAGGDLRFAAVSNGKLITVDKVNNKLVQVAESGYSDYYDCASALSTHWSASAMGPLVACDDAGNFLVHTGWSGAAAGSNFMIISADLKNTYKLDLSTVEGYTAARCDQMGRIRGNMLSAKGAYAFVVPNGGTQVLVVNIKNGAVDANYTQLSNPIAGVGLTTSCCPQPAFDTVEEINALMDENGDLSNAFIMRNRTVPGSVFAWNDDNSDMVAAWKFSAADGGCTTANASNEGFDWFKLYDKSYFIMPVTTDGTTGTRGSNFAIFDEEGTCVATWTEGQKTGLGGAMGSFIVVPNNDYSVYIYHYVPGTVAEKLCFAVEAKASGVEDVTANNAMNVVCDGSTLKVKGIDAVNVTVYSVAGELVANAKSNVVNVKGFNGVYVVTAVDTAGVSHTAKVVIR